MKALFGMFLAVLAGLVVLAAADFDGQTCENAVRIEQIPFDETINTTGSQSCSMVINTDTLVHAKGKWYHILGNNDMVTVDTCDAGTDFTVFLAVFLGCELNSFGDYKQHLFHTDECKMTFRVETAGDYYIFVGGKKKSDDTFNEGTAVVKFEQGTAPAQQYCEGAAETSSLPFTETSNTVGSDAIKINCRDDDNDYYGMWYHFVGTGKPVVASTCGEATDFDTVLYVFSECGGECNYSNDDGCGNGHALTTWFAEEGVDYYILVTGFMQERGTFTLKVEEAQYEDHGYCNDAIEVDSLPFVYHVSMKLVPPLHNECDMNHTRSGLWFHISKVTKELMAMTCDTPSA